MPCHLPRSHSPLLQNRQSHWALSLEPFWLFFTKKGLSVRNEFGLLALQCRMQNEKGERSWIESQAGKKAAEKFGPDILKHEAVHSKQWARYDSTAGYLRDCTRESVSSWWDTDTAYGSNKFEQEANLWWGGYATWGPPTMGPVS